MAAGGFHIAILSHFALKVVKHFFALLFKCLVNCLILLKAAGVLKLNSYLFNVFRMSLVLPKNGFLKLLVAA